MSKQDAFNELFQKFLDDQKLTPEEIRQLRAMVQEEQYRQQLDQMLAALYAEGVPEPLAAETNSSVAFEEVWAKLQDKDTVPTTPAVVAPIPWVQRRKWWQYAAAAVVILAGIPVAYFALRSKPSAPVVQDVQQPANDILPGGNNAVLTLADGSTIALDKAANGVLSQQGNVQVVKLANGQLAYQASGQEQAAANLINTITTPRGGRYQVTLPDGTKVWLNAASSLRYPAIFNGAVREVMLTGEAYFEVAHVSQPTKPGGQKSKMPFRVIVSDPTANNGAKKGVVEVLGTHFNVNAYAEEAVMKTTLLEGSVKVSAATDKPAASRILKPGQQALITQQQLAVVDDVDTEAAIAWKNGLIQFEGSDIHAAMRMIARCYDVTVEYRGSLPSTHFRGTVSSNGPVSGVLHMMEQTGEVHFEISGRKIIVTK